MGEDVNPEQLLKAVTLKPYGSPQEHPLLWSSFKEGERHRLIPHTNGFIETILLACAYHHNLRIRYVLLGSTTRMMATTATKNLITMDIDLTTCG